MKVNIKRKIEDLEKENEELRRLLELMDEGKAGKVHRHKKQDIDN